MDQEIAKPLPFVVVCTARCGSQSITKWLGEAGVRATHERIFSNHGDKYAEQKRLQHQDSDCEVSWCAVPWLSTSRLLRQSCIVHLMRDPWATLHSLANNVPLFGDAAKDAMGEKSCVAMLVEKQWPAVYQHDNPYDQAAEYMLAWHQMIQHEYASRTVICHRIEDDPNVLFARMRDVQSGSKWREQFGHVAIGEATVPRPRLNVKLYGSKPHVSFGLK